MRKLIIVLILLLSSPCFALTAAGKFMGVMGSGGGGGATGYIGTNTQGGSSQSVGADWGIANAVTASVSGTLGTAYVYYTGNDSGRNLMICVYTKTSSNPAVADTKVGCTGAITSGGASGWKSGSITGSVTNGNDYWITVFASTDGAWQDIATGTSAGFYYAGSTGFYASPPNSDISAIYNTGSKYPISAYVTIGY